MIMMSLGAMGHLLNKKGKQNRPQSVGQGHVSQNDMPAGPLIYDSNRVKEVDEYIRDKAISKHQKRMQYLFPSDHDKPQTVVPSVEGYSNGYPAALPPEYNQLAKDDSQAAKFARERASILKPTNTISTPINPETGKVQAQQDEDIYGGPMFRTFNFKGPEIGEFGSQAEISELTGLPLDLTHANMQPHFSSRNRREVNNDNYLVKLERFTGVDSGQGNLNRMKQETTAVWNGPQDIQMPDMRNVTDLYDRAEYAMNDRSKYSHMTSVKSTRDNRINFDNVRVLPKNIDETHPDHAKIEARGRPNSGKLAGLRAMVSQAIQRRDPLPVDGQSLLPGRGAMTGLPMVPAPGVREVTATNSTYENNYMGVPVNPFRNYAYDNMMQAHEARYDDAVIRRQDTFTPRMGNAIDAISKMPKTSGVFVERLTEKGKEATYIQPAFDGRGNRLRNVEAPDPTWMEMLDVSDHTGKMNAAGRMQGAYTHLEVDAPMTHKAMNTHNKYVGQPFKNLGQGIRQHGILDWTTMKETLLHSHTGNPKALVNAPMSYDAMFEQFTDRTEKNDYLGPARNPVTGGPYEGTEIIGGIDASRPMVENYYYGPNRLAHQSRDQEEFRQGLIKTVDKIDFGGHFNPARGTTQPMSRDTAVAIREDTSVPGRTNIGLIREGTGEQMQMQVNLKEDNVQGMSMGNAHVKTQMTFNEVHNGISIRQSNNEAINPRLDPALKITNDLFPYL